MRKLFWGKRFLMNNQFFDTIGVTKKVMTICMFEDNTDHTAGVLESLLHNLRWFRLFEINDLPKMRQRHEANTQETEHTKAFDKQLGNWKYSGLSLLNIYDYGIRYSKNNP